MRDDPKTPLGELRQILALPSRFVSTGSGGVGVLQFGAGDNRWGRQTLLLNRLFSGNEYRILAPDAALAAARRRVWFSQIPFDGSEQDVVSGLYYSVGIDRLALNGGGFAETVLPRWMSLQAFESGQ